MPEISGLGHVGQLLGTLLFRLLNSPLHISERREVVVHLAIVGSP